MSDAHRPSDEKAQAYDCALIAMDASHRQALRFEREAIALLAEVERLRAVLERVDRQLAGYAEFSPAAELHKLTHETLYGSEKHE